VSTVRRSTKPSIRLAPLTLSPQILSTGVPLDYGGECDRHDEGRDPRCLVEDPPDWCSDAWCYVDKEACRASNYKFYASDYFHDRVYSLQTCGTLTNSYNADKEKTALVGRTLHVALPEVKYPCVTSKASAKRKRLFGQC
jgi:hypothetical protein